MMRKRCLTFLFTTIFLCGLALPVLAEGPTVADFPEIAAALKSIEAATPVADSAAVIAFEENASFLYAKTKSDDAKTRNILVLKSSNVLLDMSAGSAKVFTSKDGSGNVGTLVKNVNGSIIATVTVDNQVTTVTVSDGTTDCGWIGIEKKDGETVMMRRPLADGILPHGPEGMKLMERWDRYYRDGKTAPWDSEKAAPDLVKLVEDGKVKKGRAIVLGCGSGNNAIYLAEQGFDVIGLDVAPTALAIAQQRAEKAGVKVRWMLADVLAPPELKPFDFIFDRGCYHNVRYVDAEGFMNSVKELSRAGTQVQVLSCNRKGPPGIIEETMRGDWSELFEFKWLNESTIYVGKDGARTVKSWDALLTRKK